MRTVPIVLVIVQRIIIRKGVLIGTVVSTINISGINIILAEGFYWEFQDETQKQFPEFFCERKKNICRIFFLIFKDKNAKEWVTWGRFEFFRSRKKNLKNNILKISFLQVFRGNIHKEFVTLWVSMVVEYLIPLIGLFELKKLHSGDSIKSFRVFVKKKSISLALEKYRENYRKFFFLNLRVKTEKNLGEIQSTFRKSWGSVKIWRTPNPPLFSLQWKIIFLFHQKRRKNFSKKIKREFIARRLQTMKNERLQIDQYSNHYLKQILVTFWSFLAWRKKPWTYCSSGLFNINLQKEKDFDALAIFAGQLACSSEFKYPEVF